MPSLTDDRGFAKAERTAGLSSIPCSLTYYARHLYVELQPLSRPQVLGCCCRFRKRESRRQLGMISYCPALKTALPASSECHACGISAL